MSNYVFFIIIVALLICGIEFKGSSCVGNACGKHEHKGPPIANYVCYEKTTGYVIYTQSVYSCETIDFVQVWDHNHIKYDLYCQEEPI